MSRPIPREVAPDVATRAVRALAVHARTDWREAVTESIRIPAKHYAERHESELPEFLHDSWVLSRDLRAALHKLPFRHHAVVALRWGLLDGNPMTGEQVAALLKVTRQRVQQMEAQAYDWLSKGSTVETLLAHWRNLPGRPLEEKRRHDSILAADEHVDECEICHRKVEPVARRGSDDATLCALCFYEEMGRAA